MSSVNLEIPWKFLGNSLGLGMNKYHLIFFRYINKEPTTRMLLFSDLHLSPRTYVTCMKVLRRVHCEAVQRHISVGFLGDFFDKVHSQGTLPVNILNELMRFFETEWTVPMIMIPGNHDYFDAAETEHGLTPFAYASKHIRVLDKPTVIDRQLWVPWRRSPQTIATILQENQDIDVIFGHFDIVGFKMSHTQLSTEGMVVSDFPVGIPVYSGHYHTPQKHGSIRYLGSPYQLTLSEAEDKKALVVIDHTNVSEMIPIDIGAHQYKWTPQELLTRSHELRPDDRVSVVDDGKMSIEACVQQLQDKNVRISVKRALKPVDTRISDGDTLTPVDLLGEYGKIQAIDPTSQAWILLLERLSLSGPTVQQHRPDMRPVKMLLEGFGPFIGPVTISLEGHGLTLITGESNGDTVASNGSGKSLATAGAWLWCLTGMTDGRPTLPFGCASVINEEVGKATVLASGTVNGVEWEIERSMVKKKHHLKVFIGGENKTRSTLNGTQRVIASELFGLEAGSRELFSWLVRNSVWSQHVVTRWLDASDTAAKAEIHDLANVTVWTDIHAWAKVNQKTTADKLHELQAQQKQCRRTYEDAIGLHTRSLRLATEWARNHQDKISQHEEDVVHAETAYERALKTLGEEPECVSDKDFRVAEAALVDAKVVLGRMKKRESELRSELPTEWLGADYEDKERWVREQPDPKVQYHETRQRHCQAAQHARQVQLDETRQEFTKFTAEGTCDACSRPFEKGADYHNHLRALQDKLEQKRVAFVDAKKDYVDAQQQHIHAVKKDTIVKRHKEYIDKGRSFQKLRSNIAEASELLVSHQNRVTQLREIIDKKKHQYALYSHTKTLCDDMQRTLTSMTRTLERYQQQICPHDISNDDVRAKKTEVDAVTIVVEEMTITAGHWASVLRWTGPRGIQTYALEHTVKTLGRVTSEWLQRLFHTENIQLKVFFDEKERLQRILEYKDHNGVLSGGQWRRAQLAAFMAWRETDNFPFLIMDEACTSMDIQGIRAVQDTLRNWCEEDERRTCFFISHEPEQHRDKSVYHNHTRILNKRGRSTIAGPPDNNKRQKNTQMM